MQPDIHGPAADRPPAEQQTVLRSAHRLLREGGTWSPTRLRRHLWLPPPWPGQRGPWPEIERILARDRMLWRLPDDHWVHLGAATWGRLFTTRIPPGGLPAGLVDPSPDLLPLLLSFDGWDRIPVTGHGLQGLAEVVPDSDLGVRLVLPPHIVAPGSSLMALSPSPEGLVISSGPADPVASERLRCRLQGRARHDRPPSGHGVRGRTRSWSDLDVEIAALARDPMLRRTATAPVHELFTAHPADLADSA